ncbi:DUF397 domain-containing protein [Streptomyces sp. NPDC048002]|uniref:DUF397 domain-containing protein n=1 Tax=Streptomyces sp. NPDC048002 TaxID=3154344 RepID=UPI0034001A8C
MSGERNARNAPEWFTSSYSNGAGGECVECALSDDHVLVRDSKTAGGPVLTSQRGPWQTFIRGVARGPFRIPVGQGHCPE